MEGTLKISKSAQEGVVLMKASCNPGSPGGGGPDRELGYSEGPGPFAPGTPCSGWKGLGFCSWEPSPSPARLPWRTEYCLPLTGLHSLVRQTVLVE